MSSSSKLMQQIVIDELEDLAKRIAVNIEATGQQNTGATAKSMHVVQDGSVFTLYGRGGFDNLEKGYRGKVSPRTIFVWSVDKGLHFENEKKRLGFSFRVAKKIENEGTFLYRKGKTFTGQVPDVYSSEVKKTVENLYEKLGAAVLKEIETITLNF